MAEWPALQEPFFEELCKEKVPVSIYLVNGIKLQGQIDAYDHEVVLLKNTINQMIYKHAISTVVPSCVLGLTALRHEAREDLAVAA